MKNLTIYFIIFSSILLSQDQLFVGTRPLGMGGAFTAVADDAISYKFTISGVEYLASGGILTHRFTTIGTYTYNIEVLASGTAGIMSNGAISVEVLYSFEPPDASFNLFSLIIAL